MLAAKLVHKRFTPGARGAKRKTIGEVEPAPTLGVGCLTGLGLYGFYLSLVTWGIKPGWLGWAQVAHPGEWHTSPIGLGVLAAYLGLLVSSKISLGMNFVGGIGITEGHTLITKGPYRYIRNPIYIAYGICTVGIGIYTLNAALSALFGLFTWCMMLRVPHEELLLKQQFGDEWVAYAARTGRYWPKNIRPH